MVSISPQRRKNPRDKLWRADGTSSSKIFLNLSAWRHRTLTGFSKGSMSFRAVFKKIQMIQWNKFKPIKSPWMPNRSLLLTPQVFQLIFLETRTMSLFLIDQGSNLSREQPSSKLKLRSKRVSNRFLSLTPSRHSASIISQSRNHNWLKWGLNKSSISLSNLRGSRPNLSFLACLLVRVWLVRIVKSRHILWITSRTMMKINRKVSRLRWNTYLMWRKTQL